MLTIYFHKDFDGFVATALFLRINQESQLIGAESLTLKPVDYDIKNSWLKSQLERPNVVVDFLYHPKANWWFDHHISTFLSPAHEKKFANSKTQCWDTKAPSCAALILNNLQEQSSLFMGKDEYTQIIESFKEWILWSDIIDNARYESPEQIVELNHPCLQINATLTSDVDNSYLQHLIAASKLYSPQDVVETKIVKAKFDIYRKQQNAYMVKFKSDYKIISDNIVFYDYVKNGIPFQRYLTYYYQPETHYSLGLYNRGDNYAISVGKNPWLNFQSINIGELCHKFGGGGRINVGSIIIADYNKAIEIIEKIYKVLSL